MDRLPERLGVRIAQFEKAIVDILRMRSIIISVAKEFAL
jgi:hypothetical protein